MESRTLYGHPSQEKSPTSSCPAPVLFCRDYQQEQCGSVKDHFGFIRRERKWLKHICAACWTRLRKQESHRENSSDCPLKALAAKDSPAPSKKLDYFSPSSLHGTDAGGVRASDFSCGSSDFTRDFLLQDVSPARHLASGLPLFSCPSSSFSTQDNGLLKSLQSRHSVFVSTTRPLTCSFVDTHRAVFSSGQSNYTGLRIPVPPRLNIPVWRALLHDYVACVAWRFKQLSISVKRSTKRRSPRKRVVSPSGSSRLAACFHSFAALLARLNRQATQATTMRTV